MASLDSLNLLTNGDFSNGLDNWTVENPSRNEPPLVTAEGSVSFNAENETTFGDSIEQGFATTVGNTYWHCQKDLP